MSEPVAGPARGQLEMDAAVRKKAFDLRKTAIATNSIFHLHLTNGVGSYWTLNDPEFAKHATIQPGEYKYFTMGSFRIGRYSFEFQGSSRATDDAEFKDMLNILQTLVLSRVVTNVADVALLDAAYAGDFEEACASLSNGANIDSVDGRGWTPLAYAAKMGHAKIALHLIEKGADVHRRTTTETGSTILCFATEGNKPEVIVELLKRGADVNEKSKNGMTPLAFAAQSGLLDAAKLLIPNGADVDLLGPPDVNGNSRSPLMCAGINGHLEMMDLILSHGAKIDLANSGGDTALMLTAKCDQPDALKLLIKKGARVNATGKSGHTALIYAAYNGQVENLRILLAAGADPFATATDSNHPNDKEGRHGAADVALNQGEFEAYRIIHEAQRRYQSL